MRKTPSGKSGTIGVLPKGTVLSPLGQLKNGYALVEVELENGKVQGWVPMSAVVQTVEDYEPGAAGTAPNEREEGPPPTDDLTKQAPVPSPKKKPKIRIPKDEGVLLGREPSFFYAFEMGGNVSFIGSVTSSLIYSGIGFMGGGYLGIYADRDVPIRFELNYGQFRGYNSLDIYQFNFGFLNAAIVPAYIYNRFEAFAGLQFSYGMSVGDVPTSVALASPASLSNFGLLLGGGYRFPMGPTIDLIVKAKYNVLLTRSPFILQGIALLAAIEFRG